MEVSLHRRKCREITMRVGALTVWTATNYILFSSTSPICALHRRLCFKENSFRRTYQRESVERRFWSFFKEMKRVVSKRESSLWTWRHGSRDQKRASISNHQISG